MKKQRRREESHIEKRKVNGKPSRKKRKKSR